MLARSQVFRGTESLDLNCWGQILSTLSPPTSPLGRGGRRCALTLCLGGVVVLTSMGCRSLRDRSANQKLVQARQLSLRGTDAIQRQRYQDAELLFSEALKQSTLDERAHWGYASTLWERGDKTKAIQHMEESLRLSGSNPEYAVKLGEMYLEVGDHLKARSTAESVLAANRNHSAAWALLGDTHTAEKRWATAMECYHHALLIQADYPKVQLALAEVYRNIGKPERSLAVLDRMVDLHDTARHDPVALLHRGLALSDLQRHEEASDALAKASERLPPQEVDKHLQIVRSASDRRAGFGSAHTRSDSRESRIQCGGAAVAVHARYVFRALERPCSTVAGAEYRIGFARHHSRAAGDDCLAIDEGSCLRIRATPSRTACRNARLLASSLDSPRTFG